MKHFSVIFENENGSVVECYVLPSMNGPKLLTKGSSMETSSHESMTSAQAATKLGKGNSTPINRYLWDDDGNENGIARIISTVCLERGPHLP
jgi:hypothetical protein